MFDESRLRLSFGGSDPALVYRSICGAMDAILAHDGAPIESLERMSHGLAELVDAIFIDGRLVSAEITRSKAGLVATMSYAGSVVALDAAATQIVQGAFDEVGHEDGLLWVRVGS